jgi:sugar phosphate isomerase/epimerase
LQIGLFTDAFVDRPLSAVVEWLGAELPAVRDLELATGGYSPAPHAADPVALRDSLGDCRLSALNVSGNPLEVPEHDRALRETIGLAATLEVDRVVCMSGGRAELSGGGWFPGVEEAVESYWTARVLPYWSEISELAGAVHPPLRLCFELEPGAAAYNVSTVERLLDVGENLAVNLDPSHFFWQSIDPLAAVRTLAGRIGFAHGKDTVLDEQRVRLDGVLDRRAWRYATVGRGRGVEWWRAFTEELQRVGYDGVVSIEYEDPLVAPEQSVAEAAQILSAALREPVTR